MHCSQIFLNKKLLIFTNKKIQGSFEKLLDEKSLEWNENHFGGT